MAKLVIYTAIVQDKDKLRDPTHVLPGVDYVCFTDTPGLTSRVFDIRPLPFAESTPRLTARRLKLFSHELFPGYEASLWIDASKHMFRDITPLLAQLSQAPFSTFAHFARDCLYEEGKECISSQRDVPETIAAQIEHYRACAMPAHAGLYETSLLYRRHTPENAALMQSWWKEVQTQSPRDQISLPYVLHRHATTIQALNFRQWHDPYLLQYPHKWNPSGDSRNRWTQRARNSIWRKLQRYGLHPYAQWAIKHFNHLFRPHHP